MAYSRSTKAMARPKNSRHNIPAQAPKKKNRILMKRPESNLRLKFETKDHD
jgi:hypothetical protein